VIQARMKQEIYERDNLREFDAFATSISDKYFGMPLVGKQLEDYMKRDFLVSTLIAAALIIFILWGTLRGGIRALLAATPLILGYVWMLGGMKLLQIDFNFINITISPLLIGIGVDNGIHILHRYAEERAINSEGAIERGGRMTAVAVIVTSLTTMLVFGSLLLARTPGLRLLGASALFGIGFALVFSLLFLPAAIRVEGGDFVMAGAHICDDCGHTWDLSPGAVVPPICPSCDSVNINPSGWGGGYGPGRGWRRGRGFRGGRR